MFGHDHRRLHHRALTPVSTVNLAAAVTLSLSESAGLGYSPEALSAAPIVSVYKSLADLALNDQEVSLRAETSLTIAADAALAADISLAAAPSTGIAADAVLAADISLAAAPQLFINRQLAWLNLDNALAATPQIQMQAVVDPNPVALAATGLIQFTVTVDPNALALNAPPLMRISRQQARLALNPMVLSATPLLQVTAAAAVQFPEQLSPPFFDPNGGSFEGLVDVVIYSSMPGPPSPEELFFYTIDGSTPTRSSAIFVDFVRLTNMFGDGWYTLKAIAARPALPDDWRDSEVAEVSFFLYAG